MKLSRHVLFLSLVAMMTLAAGPAPGAPAKAKIAK